MKNITKFFGACAAVALFSACSSEEDIATAEGLVPEGMKKVSVTINEQLFADETGKKRVSMDKNGNFTWNSDASIAVVYEGQGKTQIYRFSGDNSVINDGVTGNFQGEIPFDVWLTMTPTHVYSEHTGNFTNTASVDEYTQVKTNQENAEDLWNGSDAICIDRPTENLSDFKYDLHLHGVPDFSDGHCVGDKRVSTFQATLSLDVAAFVHIDREDLPCLPYDKSDLNYKVNFNGQNYTITCKEGNLQNTYQNGWDGYVPTGGLSFFVKVPEGGIANPVITVTGDTDPTCPKPTIAFTTQNGKTLLGAKRYKLVSSTTIGTAKATIGSNQVDVLWVQLWNGGPKFAAYNVGATKAEEYGGYYCWGGNEDKDPNRVYKTGKGVSLTGTDDTATNLWGENWRMPTDTELRGLRSNCNVETTSSLNGVRGYKFKGKGNYASNSIFLPFTGYFYNGNVDTSNSAGYYWSSSPANTSEFANSLSISYYGQGGVQGGQRDHGYSVRAVLAE